MYPDVVLFEALLFLFGGLWLLAWSSDRFVWASACLARRLRLSSFVVGFVIVGFGTSLSELMVSAVAAFRGHSDLSLGNAYGSNIFNVAVILGFLCLLRPIRIRRSVRLAAVPLLILVTAASWASLACFGRITRPMAAAAILLFVGVVAVYARFGRRSARSLGPDREASGSVSAVGMLFFLATLLLASHLVVWGSVVTARRLGLSELMIGLTVVAAGTSLPELATSLAALRRREMDIVLGNVIGSNFFNAVVVVGASALIREVESVPEGVLWRDLTFSLILTCGLLCRRLTCWRGALALASFVLYLVLLLCIR